VKRTLRIVLALIGVACAGCTALPDRPSLVPEHGPPPATYGTLADYSGRIRGRLGSDESAHWLLDRNDLAFTGRLALADEAAHTLDVQYFIWQDDATGFLMVSRLLAAADRGVKIRVLVDDFGVSSARGDVLRLDAHPGIEVRTFNPWATRGPRIVKAVEFLIRAHTLNRRMHNKTFIADNLFAIVGGRNIGDRYFGVYERFVQNDLDVLLAGPVVEEVTDTFDAYWNSAHTFPVRLFAREESAMYSIETTREWLETELAQEAALLSAFPLMPRDWSVELEGWVESYAAGQARMLWDTPEILDADRPRLYADFKQLVATAESEVLISSPYFIPDRTFRDLLRQLVARGVRVAVVTNSLASNNHIVAHTGYRRWRRELLAIGVELYELRADAAALSLYATPPATPEALGLHTKAVVVDGQRVFVGSPNVDPRSMVLNTEIGVVTEGADLAARVGALIVRDMSPPNAWRVTMDEAGWLTWSNDVEVLRRQPAKGFGQRTIEFLLNLLPIKRQA